ncbi:peptidyl-prolyl cis-trans isomerase FKBP11 isoform X5 [Callithrix jacchus]|uniref:peptidyl-prolyl cis-trans isomerase FKBP11 isoform X4 n=1 Tax=Callithrix jacchus TaxID=9483 RepID=UPI00159DDA8B|nr:peptidyl-prolyl cis-trans isomerase FKBP11 isoform X4 [Callithrix jacchus]
MTLRPSLLPLHMLLLLLLSAAVCGTETGFETESPVRTLQVETLVEPPEPCAEPAAFGDTLHIHYTGSLVDGRIIDTSLTRDPLVIELGQKQVIPGLEQSLLDMCVGSRSVGPKGIQSLCASCTVAFVGGAEREAKGNHSFSLGLWKTGISTICPRKFSCIQRLVTGPKPHV